MSIEDCFAKFKCMVLKGSHLAADKPIDRKNSDLQTRILAKRNTQKNISKINLVQALSISADSPSSSERVGRISEA